MSALSLLLSPQHYRYVIATLISGFFLHIAVMLLNGETNEKYSTMI